MKRLSIVLALMLAMSLPMMAERVTPETARKVASTFLTNNGAKSAQLTDLSKAAGFANLYIFTADPGFVVMASDDCVQPILGYSLTGQFVAENMPENITSWLQGYNDEIQFAIESKAKPSAETAKLWKDLIDGDSKAAKATTVVDNLLSTTWDQIHPYNALCPRDPSTNQLTVTGCMATAMAQIMKYWDYPVRGKSENFYSTPKYGTLYVNFGESEYDWANIPSFLTNASTQEQIEAVATLMYHCGVAVNMQYDIASNGGSLANSTALDYAYPSYFNYSSSVS
ncbi:MAG: C10 family peptidase [Bacteroidales bacterium]|nr:C10 family peptidase [Bacteroidales bacterium]